MYRLRISRSFGGETPMILQSQRAFSNKAIALAAVFRSLPEDVEINWTKGNSENDIKFDFRMRTCRYQVWIDPLPVIADDAVLDLFQDESITEYPRWCNKKGFHFD